MKKILVLFLFIIPVDANAKSYHTPTGMVGTGSSIDTESTPTETRPFFKSKDLDKPKYILVGEDFDVTYSLLTVNENCKVPLEIKNISKEEKRNTFSIEVYSYANKKYEAFITEKRSKPGEIVNTQVIFANIDCHDIKRINFYR